MHDYFVASVKKFNTENYQSWDFQNVDYQVKNLQN